MKKINLSLAHMSGNEMKYINEAFDTNWIVPLGPNVDEFENELADWINSKSYTKSYAVALCSGTAAIHLSLVMLGVKAGDEVLCQSFTFAATANPILYQGAKPVFIDSEKDTWNMDPVLLERAIRDRIERRDKLPKAIIVVHLYGVPAKMNRIMEISEKYGIPIVEDAAEAMGSEYNGYYCGTFGKYGIISFNGNKMITTSGGGTLICHSLEEVQKIKFYATQAREALPYYQHKEIGYNYRLSNISAGIGRGQMTVLGKHIEMRRRTHSIYKSLLESVDGINVFSPYSEIPIQPNYWLTTMLLDENSLEYNSSQLNNYMNLLGVETRRLWKPLHLQPVFQNCDRYVNSQSERIFNSGICLPSGPMVTDNDLGYIINKLSTLNPKKKHLPVVKICTVNGMLINV